MTTTSNKRTIGDNPARDETEGVPIDGFQDPTGEYPKREYNYGSSINKAARGLKTNNLYVGGGDIGVSLNIEHQEPSQYPFNQVKETASGHVVEYDDTPGGERILIKHRKGAGVEVRADGSVIISAVNNKIEVTGGDQTLIVEGNGNLVYKGNMNLQVTGDYNVDVGGNYNVNVAGNNTNNVQLNQRTEVSGDHEMTIKKSSATKILDNKAEIVLGNNTSIVKGSHNHTVQGDIAIYTDTNMHLSGKDTLVAVSQNTTVSGSELSVMGMKGVIGGEKVEITAPVFMGPKGAVPFTSGASFYGSFHGQALEAINSITAWSAQKSKYADKSGQANKAASKSGTPSPIPSGGAPQKSQNMENLTPEKEVPVADLVGAFLSTGSFGVRTVTVDAQDNYKNKILLIDDYDGVFEKHPSTQELRSAMRDPNNKSNLGAKMVGLGKISSSYTNTSPPKIGRTSPKTPSSRFGYIPLGNAIANRGKRFTP